MQKNSDFSKAYTKKKNKNKKLKQAMLFTSLPILLTLK